MVVWMRRALPDLRDHIGAEDDGTGKFDVVAQPRTHLHGDAEFFVEFARERLAVGFTGGDLAARQFPTAGQLGGPVALGYQQRRATDQRACDDDLDWHQSRRYPAPRLTPGMSEPSDPFTPAPTVGRIPVWLC